MLKFYFTRGEIPQQRELDFKNYLTILRISAFEDVPYFILESSSSQFIDPEFNFLHIEYN